MQTFLTILHVFTCLILVLVVLIQSGKGAEISASFSGSTQTVFGSSGGANFFTRFTAGAAAIFMLTSLGLTLLGSQKQKSVFDDASASKGAPAAPQAPAAPADAAKPADGATAPQADPATPQAPAPQQ